MFVGLIGHFLNRIRQTRIVPVVATLGRALNFIFVGAMPLPLADGIIWVFERFEDSQWWASAGEIREFYTRKVNGSVIQYRWFSINSSRRQSGQIAEDMPWADPTRSRLLRPICVPQPLLILANACPRRLVG